MCQPVLRSPTGQDGGDQPVSSPTGGMAAINPTGRDGGDHPASS
jgi:hypothetical protein